jgi:hypothetical protein
VQTGSGRLSCRSPTSRATRTRPRRTHPGASMFHKCEMQERREWRMLLPCILRLRP